MYESIKKLIDWLMAVEKASRPRPRQHFIVRYYMVQDATRVEDGCAFASMWMGVPGMPVKSYVCMN